MPPANALLPETAKEDLESFPLHAIVCNACHLVQLSEIVDEVDIFSDYAYFSSYSSSWLEHSRRYVDEVIDKWSLDSSSRVVELASNDGYLLKNFVRRQIPCLGVEPAENVALVAIDDGVPTDVSFFGIKTAERLKADFGAADLIVANNVLAHVPDLNDFIAGAAVLLAPKGVWTIEVPHLLRLIEDVQFDTIYHEHYSYFSLIAIQAAVERHGLRVVDVKEINSHGGSLRVSVCHHGIGLKATPKVEEVLACERTFGLGDPNRFTRFQREADTRANAFSRFMNDPAKSTIVGYGAAAKGATLLNYCRIGAQEMPYVVDRNPWKQNKRLPGSDIPIRPVEAIESDTSPAHLMILPWNLWDEIRSEMSHIRDFGTRFAYLARDEVVVS